MFDTPLCSCVFGECVCAYSNHLGCPGWRRQAWPWVQVLPQASVEPFPNLLPVCLEYLAPSPTAAPKPEA